MFWKLNTKSGRFLVLISSEANFFLNYDIFKNKNNIDFKIYWFWWIESFNKAFKGHECVCNDYDSRQERLKMVCCLVSTDIVIANILIYDGTIFVTLRLFITLSMLKLKQLFLSFDSFIYTRYFNLKKSRQPKIR